MSRQVSVLLATYNGVRYLREQLESIEAQTVPVACITVRDAGSTDGSEALVRAWAKGRSNVRILPGSRMGAARSFFALLSEAESECHYIAFADQDDVWLPGKIERALLNLERQGPEQAAMYCSRVEYVNEHLEHIGHSRMAKSLSFRNALVENIAIGCTVVLNRKAAEMLRRRIPERVIMHDWWFYLAISALGKVIFDEWPSVKYRQHGDNAVGGTSSRVALLARGLSRFVRGPAGRTLLSEQALEFRNCFGSCLTQRDKETLDGFLTVRGGLWARLRYNFKMGVWRDSWVDRATLRAMILLGRA